MTLDLVSVIIPCFNAEKWISKTLDSILAQSHRNLEIIVVHDGSTDSSAYILEEYVKKGIKVFRHPEGVNRGGSNSLNLGIEKSSAEYIAFLDADDLWHPQKISTQLAYLKGHPNTAMVYSNGWAIDENDKILYDLLPDNHRETNSPCELLMNCYIRTPGTILVRKSILEQVGGFDPTLSAGDHDLLLRIAENFNIRYIPDQLTYYRRHPGQLSTGRKQWLDGFVILDKAISRYPYPGCVVKKRKAVLQYRLAEHDISQKKYITGGIKLIRSALLDPRRSINVAKNYIFQSQD